ncbi:MAG TPA: TetR/AcrR family transcriptional regulator [Pseudonocardiaceae bacterium]
MTEATRRERLRGETEREIRTQARTLLVERGRESVTLRAIARELGITAPALYRYYGSREELLQAVCEDIACDLADALRTAIEEHPEDQVTERVYAACREFRRWALAHPHEFALVFASPGGKPNPGTPDGGDPFGLGHAAHDQFAKVFLSVAIPLFCSGRMTVPADSEVPEVLHEDLAALRDLLIAALEGENVEHIGQLTLGVCYLMLRCWARLYGYIALEVFGHLRFAVYNTEPLFEAMLAELAADVGLDE